jgi:hypothetical protein
MLYAKLSTCESIDAYVSAMSFGRMSSGVVLVTEIAHAVQAGEFGRSITVDTLIASIYEEPEVK